ncbi:MAG: AAA family ATPase [Acidimicrobiales bacterium]
MMPPEAGSTLAGPVVAVLDEFPYLREKAPELPSLLQRAVDRSKEEGWPPVRLILCGSAISVMAGFLEGQGALRGRVQANIVIRPFTYLDPARSWNLADPQLAFRIGAILGGTPGCRACALGAIFDEGIRSLGSRRSAPCRP